MWIPVLVVASAVASTSLAAQGVVRATTQSADVPASPVLQVAIVSLRADGSERAAASAGGDGPMNYTLQMGSACGLTASTTGATGSPRIGWRAEARVTNTTADGVAARVEWQRLWDAGAASSEGQRGTTEVTLKAGETLLLDSVALPPESNCDAVAVRLQLTAGPRLFGRGAFGRAGGGGGVLRGAGAGAGGTMTGRGGARGSGGGSSLRAGFGSGGAVSGRRVTDPMDLEVWLVHQPPAGGEAVQRIAMQGVPGTAAFEFPIVPVGSVGVELTGRLSVVLNANDAPGLQLTFNRLVHDGSGRASASSGSRGLAMPGPADVVSFELPAVTGAHAPVLQGHRFSLRVRVGPGKR